MFFIHKSFGCFNGTRADSIRKNTLKLIEKTKITGPKNL